MIRKLKWKFVAIMMTIVTIMLIIIFAILFYSTPPAKSAKTMVSEKLREA